MFRKIKNIEAVDSFLLTSGEFVYLSNKVLKRSREIQENRVIRVSLDDFDLEFLQKLDKGEIVCIGGEGVLIFDAELNLVNKLEHDTVNFPLLENKYLVTLEAYNGLDHCSKYGMLDLLTNTLIWETDWLGMIEGIGSESLFSVDKTSIQKINFDSGGIKWNYRLEPILKGIYPFLLGQIDDLALFGLTDQDKVIGLNIDSGELVWELTTIPWSEKLDGYGFLHSLTGAYIKTDASTGQEVVKFTDRSCFDEVDILSQRGNFAFVGDHIITTDHLKGRIGAFNTKTFKFDWIHDELDVFFPSPRPVIYEEPYLLLHDNKDTLHIFKKE